MENFSDDSTCKAKVEFECKCDCKEDDFITSVTKTIK